MSNSISINNIDYLPNEQTILIRYLIESTGLWYLSQLTTAYRGVCDTEWTVMFPNNQHPQHTDFPILVDTPGKRCTFAWNYGGIQGISSENFDSQHSYLVQLSIFEYGCNSAGQQIPINTDPVATSPTTIPGGNQPGIVINGPVPPAPPPPVRNPGGGGPTTIPTAIANPGPINANTNDPIFTPASTSVPSTVEINSPFIIYQQSDPIGYTNIEPTVVGSITTTAHTPPLNNTPYVVSTPTITNPIFNEPVVVINAYTPQSNTSYQIEEEAEEEPSSNSELPDSGIILETFPTYYRQIYHRSPVLQQSDLVNIVGSATLDLQVMSNQVYIGDPVVYSSFFRPPQGMICYSRIEIRVQDSNGSMLINSAYNEHASYESPVTCGGSFSSSLFSLGNLTIIMSIFDNLDRVVGIRSISVSNNERPPSGGSGGNQSTTVVIGGTSLPSQVNNVGEHTLDPDGTLLDLREDSSLYVIIAPKPNVSTELTAVLTSSQDATVQYQFKVYNVSNDIVDIPPEDQDATVDGSTLIRDKVLATPLLTSKERLKVNGQLWYPETHNVGIVNGTIAEAFTYLIMEIAPSVGSSSSINEARLYLSDNYTIREVATSVLPTQIAANLPYSNETYGLIIHGQTNHLVPNQYNILEATSNIKGVTYWYNLSLSPGDYYSIISKSKGVFNPFKNVIYNGRYVP